MTQFSLIKSHFCSDYIITSAFYWLNEAISKFRMLHLQLLNLLPVSLSNGLQRTLLIHRFELTLLFHNSHLLLVLHAVIVLMLHRQRRLGFQASLEISVLHGKCLLIGQRSLPSLVSQVKRLLQNLLAHFKAVLKSVLLRFQNDCLLEFFGQFFSLLIELTWVLAFTR